MRLLPVLLCLLAACGSAGAPGRTVSYEWTREAGSAIVEYSEYFEFEARIADGKVRAHLIITLGPERVPPDFRFPPGPLVRDGRLNRRARADEIVESVFEFYFTNLSDAPIVLEPMDFEVRPLGPIALSPSLIFLGPK